jgi:pSer/pThr/pTyr-binding forkhead associated (FHA) protein
VLLPEILNSMALITVRILDGPDRGREFHQIATPVTIGREEGNLIQLNDHRVSRHHVKIHENDSAVLMTDLQSTNGTKVNGELVRVWQLYPGDLITVGQSMLLFGSASAIAERLATLKALDMSAAVSMGTGGDESDLLNWTSDDKKVPKLQSSQMLAKEIFSGMATSDLSVLHKLPPPILPTDMSPQQAAQIEAFLQYVHLRLRHLITTVRSTPHTQNEISTSAKITVSAAQWQNIIDLHSRIASYMSSPAIGDGNRGELV